MPQQAAAQSSEGNIKAAWRDITSSPGWVKRVLVLCLIGCVPILNFAVEGYSVRWARDLSFGKREGLPTTIFKKKEISTGFFAWLVRIGLWSAFCMLAAAAVLLLGCVFGLVNAVAAGVVTTILIVALAVFCVFFFNPAVDASVMRMSVVGYLESGFNFSVVWKAFKGNMGGLIGASFLPRFVVGCVQGIIVFLLSFIAGLIMSATAISALSSSRALSAFSSYGSSSSAYNASLGTPPFVGDFVNTIVGIGSGLLFLTVLIWIISAMFNVFSTLLAYRAVGHWVARSAREWAAEGDEGMAPSSDSQGGVALNNIVPNAASQPPLPYGAPAVSVAAPQQPQQNNLSDQGDSGTARLVDNAGQFALLRRSNGCRYDINTFPATIGKGSAANVRIEDNNAISRTHVRIVRAGASYVLEELGATNKTYLNGNELAEGEVAALSNGDLLSLAGEEFTVVIG